MEQSVSFTQNIVKCLAGIDFQVIENSDRAWQEYIRGSLDGLFLELSPAPEQTAMYRLLQPDCVYTFQTPIGLQYCVFSDLQKNLLFILGPSLIEDYSEKAVRQKLLNHAFSQETVSHIITHVSRLPAIPLSTLHQLCGLLVSQFTGTRLFTYQTVDLALDFGDFSHSKPQNEIPTMRQVVARYEMSAILTEAVKQGNFSMAMEPLRNYRPIADNEIRNVNPLRNMQNYFIVLNTQLRHALEETGIHPYRLDQLSNQIGLEIENIRSVEHAQNFVFQIIQRYCRLVRESTYPNLKPLVHLAVTYIKEHLNEDLTVKDTAKVLGVNANYLSSQFHDNMGITFIDFIHRERTAQAAALLKHTNLQIQQVASAVGYNNTSYFAKQFQRFQGMNPSHYRQAGII